MIHDDEIACILTCVLDIPPRGGNSVWGRDWWVVTPSGNDAQDFLTGQALARQLQQLGDKRGYALRMVMGDMVRKLRYGAIEQGFTQQIGQMMAGGAA